MSVGPVDFAVIAFPGNKFHGQIAPALGELVAAGTVRILDLVFVKKDADGTVMSAELSALDPDEASPFDEVPGEVSGLLNEEDLELAAAALEPDSSAAIVVWETSWAARLADAVAAADSQLLDFERIPREVVEAAVAAAGSP